MSYDYRDEYLIAAYWSGNGVQLVIEFENNILESMVQYYHSKGIINYCFPTYSKNPFNLTHFTSEWMVFKGMAHFAGSYQTTRPRIPFEFLYPIRDLEFSIYSRHLKLEPPWTNMTNVFGWVVWCFIIVSVVIIPIVVFFIMLTYKNYIYGSDVLLASEVSLHLSQYKLAILFYLEPICYIYHDHIHRCGTSQRIVVQTQGNCGQTLISDLGCGGLFSQHGF